MASEMLRGLFAERDKAFTDYEHVAKTFRTAAASGVLPDGYQAAYDEHRDALDALTDRIVEVEADEDRANKVNAARARSGLDLPQNFITAEPRTYGEGTGNSFYADLCWSAMPGDPHYIDAQARMLQHGREVVRDSQTDPALRARVIKSAREHYRNAENRGRTFIADLESRAGEVRAMDTGSSSGGSFVTPQYLVDDWAKWNQFGRTFVDATNRQNLPEYGMTVFLPAIQGPAAVAAQVGQNQGIVEGDPTAGYLQSSLITEAGQVTVAQQLLDRAGPGVEFDKILFMQLTQSYNQAIDTAVILASLANAGTVTDTLTTATSLAVLTDLYSDIAKASQQMETTPGTILPPSHIFTTPTEWGFVSSQLDATGRPLIVPSYAGPFNAVAASISGKENIVTEGDTGYELLSLPVHKNGNIPQSGANTQLIVAHMPEVWVWEGTPVPRTVPQTYAQNMSVLLQLYSYWTCIVRYPKAIQAITGARYPAVPSFPQV